MLIDVIVSNLGILATEASAINVPEAIFNILYIQFSLFLFGAIAKYTFFKVIE